MEEGRAVWARDGRQWPVVTLMVGMLLVWCALLAYHVRADNGFVLGDWVLDYRQGFTRRGAIGAALWPLARWSHVSVTVWAAVMATIAYAVMLIALAAVLARRCKPVWYLLWLASPAALAFPYFSLAEVARKEVLHFALLAAVVWCLHRRIWHPVLAALAVASAGLLVLSHEMLVFYAPYFCVATFVSWQTPRAWRLTAAAMLLASVGAVAALWLWARPLDGAGFCASLLAAGHSASLCQGIVLWPIQDLEGALRNTWLTVTHYDYVRVYPVSLVCAALPVALWWRRYPGQHVGRLAWASLACVLWSLPLFALAQDWGRFIQVHLVSLALVLALALRRLPLADEPPSMATLSQPRFPWQRSNWGVLLLVLCLSWPLFWHLPTCCEADVGAGWAGKASGWLSRRLAG